MTLDFKSDLFSIRIISVTFCDYIKQIEIPAFRGAFAEKVGFENELFHNHKAEGGFHYSYPLIQYKCRLNMPMVFCIGTGTDEMYHFFNQKNKKLSISGRTLEMDIDKLIIKTYKLKIWNTLFNYSIRNWISLNKENYEIFKSLESDKDKQLQFLSKKLIGNILSFAKGVKWFITQPIELQITKINRIEWLDFKGVKVLSFNVSFQTNTYLPNYLGLGKHVSSGFGVVTQNKK